MEEVIKYEELTIKDLEIIYNFFNGKKGFVCDGDNKVIKVEE